MANRQIPPSMTVLVVDDHPAMRAGFTAALNDHEALSVIGQASDGAEAIAMFEELLPDVVVLDWQLPDLSGEAVLRRLIERRADAKLIVITTYGEEETIKKAVDAGCRGFLLKDAPLADMINAILAVGRGERVVRGIIAERLAASRIRDPLSPREIQVLREIARGAPNREVARHLSITQATVKTHVGHILDKLGATDRTDAVVTALKLGIVRIE